MNQSERNNDDLAIQTWPGFVRHFGIVSEINPPEYTIVTKTNQDDVENTSATRPDYYRKGIEVLAFIQSWDLGFELGNCVKYLARAKHKANEIEDLEKAREYLDRYITHRKDRLSQGR